MDSTSRVGSEVIATNLLVTVVMSRRSGLLFDGRRWVGLDIRAAIRTAVFDLEDLRMHHRMHTGAGQSKARWDGRDPRLTIAVRCGVVWSRVASLS